MEREMENNILTAKEWLEKDIVPFESIVSGVDLNIDKMERYANYRNKMLEDKFSKYWKEAEMRLLELEGRLKFIENIYEGSKQS